ncbi:MAG: ATPase, partial [Methylococcales bacterium]
SPDDFVSWVFPELFKSRVPRYQAIADQYGYTIDANEAAQVSNEAEFMQLIADTLKED